jgi:2-oxoglutarate ferredoxin oxidoreductase subunit beta
MKVAQVWGDEIPIGVIFECDCPAYEQRVPVLADGPLVGRAHDPAALKAVVDSYR